MKERNLLLNGMIYIFAANMINLGLNVMTNFLLPKYLSVDVYADIKTYQLYISYVGALHFGYSDGLYLKYGGDVLNKKNAGDISSYVSTLRLFLVFISVCVGIGSVFVCDTVLIWFSLSIVPLVMISFFSTIYQATGNFGRYSKILNCTSMLNCITVVLLIFVVKAHRTWAYLCVYVIGSMVIWMFLEHSFYENYSKKLYILYFSFFDLIDNCKQGFHLMVGNLVSILLTAMDRLFVKFLLANEDFAFYSLAVSMEGFLNAAITPVTVTLYNYFCVHKNVEEIRRMRNLTMIGAAFVLVVTFPLKFVIEHFLQNYLNALTVMVLLFASQLFGILNKAIYTNLYKAYKRQKIYFNRLVITIISGVVLNVICYLIMPVKEAFAMGTLFAMGIWLILCSRDFPDIYYRWNEISFLLFIVISFIFSGCYFGSVLGLLNYLFYMFIAIILFMRRDMRYLLISLKKLKKVIIAMEE